MITVQTGEAHKKFEAYLLAYVQSGAYGNKHRPYFAVLATSKGAYRPVLANLRDGKRLESGRDAWEFLKTGGYSYQTQRVSSGHVTTIYLPSLSNVDPEIVGDEVRFLCVPTADMVVSSVPKVSEALLTNVPKENHQDISSLAKAVCGMIDRRVGFPIPASSLVQEHIFVELLRARLLQVPKFRGSYVIREYGLEELGFYGSIYMHASATDIAGVVSHVVENLITLYGRDVLWQD